MSNLIQRMNTDDLFSEDQLTKINSTQIDKLFIIGYPCELGTRNQDGRAGVEKGPESFREILHLTGFPSNPTMPACDVQNVSFA